MEIIHKSLSLLIVAGALALLPGCVEDPVIHPQEQQSQDPQPSNAVDITLKQYTKISSPVSEISGMCFNKDASGFFVVSDEEGLFEVGLDGKKVREIWTSSSWGKGEDHDLEAVAYDAAGGKLYVLDETESRIYLLSGTNLDTRSVFMDIKMGGTDSDKGPEGMSWGDGKLFVTNQGSPTKLAIIDVAAKKVTTEKNISFVKKYLSDVCYDSKDGTLWIIDSKADAFFHCSQDGTLLGTYRLGFSVAQAEAIAIDRKNSCVWLGSDEKPSSSIYKIPLTF